jgi:lipoprotein-anchoring transpeptidase ErfK/SrfK
VQGDRGRVPARGERFAEGSQRRRTAAVLAAVAALLLVTGCQGSDGKQGAAGSSGSGSSQQAVDENAPTVAFSPASAAADVRPDTPVHVTVEDGTLRSVSLVDQKGRGVDGSISSDKTSWTATGTLRLNRKYTVIATAVNDDGQATRRQSRFTTLKPARFLLDSISPLSGSTVGVGMPIVVKFNHPVGDRAAVEKSLVVTSSKPAPGGWRWLSDTEVHYRPQQFWPAQNKVSLAVQLRGVEAGQGTWGKRNRTVEFQTASSLVSTVDVARHTLTVRRNGKVARVIPVSTGKAGFLTRNGTKVVLEKFVNKTMDASTIGIGQGDPEYYRLQVPYALRVTWSGEFVHAAPWSVGSQGRVNVSHGCVGMSMKNAIWLFNQTHVGDVVRVVNSPRQLEDGNGWTDWNVPWSTWAQGSALA